MASEIVDLYIETGVSFSMSVTLTDEVNEPYDFSLYTFKFVLDTGSRQFVGSVIEEADGVALLQFEAGETQVMPIGVGKYYVDIIEDASGFNVRLIKGRAYIDGGIL